MQQNAPRVFHVDETTVKNVELDGRRFQRVDRRQGVRRVKVEETGASVDVIFARRVQFFENVDEIIMKTPVRVRIIDGQRLGVAVDFLDAAEVRGPFSNVKTERPNIVGVGVSGKFPTVRTVEIITQSRRFFAVHFVALRNDVAKIERGFPDVRPTRQRLRFPVDVKGRNRRDLFADAVSARRQSTAIRDAGGF